MEAVSVSRVEFSALRLKKIDFVRLLVKIRRSLLDYDDLHSEYLLFKLSSPVFSATSEDTSAYGRNNYFRTKA